MEVWAHRGVLALERGRRDTGGVHPAHPNYLSSNCDTTEFIDDTAQSLASDCGYTPKCWDKDSGSSILKSLFVPIPTNDGKELDPKLVTELPCQVSPTADSIR